MFGKRKIEDVATVRIEDHVQRVIREAVDAELERLNDGRATEEEKLGIERELTERKKQLIDLQIRFDQEQEQHERLTREIEHKVGLHKQQVEHEITAAKKETELQVKEQNLNAERERFEKEMTFMRDRFETEVGYLREMMGEVLGRLPEVKVERTYRTEEHIGDRPAEVKELGPASAE